MAKEESPERSAFSEVCSGIAGVLAIINAMATIFIIYHRLGIGDAKDPAHWSEMSLKAPLAGTIVFGALAVLASRKTRCQKKKTDNKGMNADQ